jgi:hypothetical protein
MKILVAARKIRKNKLISSAIVEVSGTDSGSQIACSAETTGNILEIKRSLTLIR